MKISLQIISLPLSIHTVNAHAVPGAPDFCPSAGGLGGFLHLLMVKEWTATVGASKGRFKKRTQPVDKTLFSLFGRRKDSHPLWISNAYPEETRCGCRQTVSVKKPDGLKSLTKIFSPPRGREPSCDDVEKGKRLVEREEPDAHLLMETGFSSAGSAY